jgi:hypothetical protein
MFTVGWHELVIAILLLCAFMWFFAPWRHKYLEVREILVEETRKQEQYKDLIVALVCYAPDCLLSACANETLVRDAAKEAFNLMKSGQHNPLEGGDVTALSRFHALLATAEHSTEGTEARKAIAKLYLTLQGPIFTTQELDPVISRAVQDLRTMLTSHFGMPGVPVNPPSLTPTLSIVPPPNGEHRMLAG